MDDTRILVVEDDADINEVVCERLGRDGYVCVPAYSAIDWWPGCVSPAPACRLS